MSFHWAYVDKAGKTIPLNFYDSEQIETEYSSYVDGTRIGQVVYHCFGKGSSACIDFDEMKTECGSNGCERNHGQGQGRIPSDHMTYELKRTIKQVN